MVFKECVIQTLKQDPAAFPHPNLKERQSTIGSKLHNSESLNHFKCQKKGENKFFCQQT